ncbi:hypothetical protein FHS15_000517 [Paenibacillus castaneae]|uniref:S-layer homology domain-containing protein n=1 Tax=Paenibacillus castaneae TaxID=474957 RepID=UPI000C9C8936|nr:S-layer homology domain-containing protein [Paenibacillus castaneae]NIK75419.1 hypothetical protein [Paenibacillus castaneae]
MINCKRFSMVGWFVLVFILAVPSFAMAAADTPVFTLSQHQADKKIRIDITGDKLKDVYAFEVKLEFDTKKLRFDGASSSMTGFSITPIVEGAQIVYATTKIGKKAGDSGKIALTSLLFESIGKGKAEVKLTDVKLVNSALESITLKPNVKMSAVLDITVFKDIAGHWAKSAIERAVNLGFINGYTDGTFRPNAQVTRAEYAAMLVRALDLPIKDGEKLSFKDAGSVPSWASDYVAAAVEAGIITGYEDHTFRASKPIKRSEIAVMIARALSWQVDPAQKSSFADRNDIPVWAHPSVAMAAEAGIIKGRDANRFVPNANATRAEAVTLLLSMIDYKQSHESPSNS